MKNGYNYEDYLFVSARIRAKENSLIGHSDLMSMVSASSIDELYRMLDDKGIVAENDPRNGRNYDAVLAKRLPDAYDSVFSDIPERSLFTVFTYPYDCHNLKTAIKYAQKGSSGASVMIPLGTVSPEKTEEAVIKGDCLLAVALFLLANIEQEVCVFDAELVACDLCVFARQSSLLIFLARLFLVRGNSLFSSSSHSINS